MHSKSRNKAKNPESSEGILYVVATPIGNLEDITYRAVRILGEVDLIAAEDTRNTARLLSHYDIKTRVISCHDHNEDARAEHIIKMIVSGMSVAVVSDAGTPLISDPGYRVVESAAANGIKIVPVPGASSLLAALSASGLPVEKFTFMGFAPRQSSKRKSFLEKAAALSHTSVFFESPHRIIDLLTDMIPIFGNRQAVAAREITKLYEEFLRGSITEIIEALSSRETVKGEFVLLIDGQEQDKISKDVAPEETLETEIKEMLGKSLKTSEIAKKLSEKYRLPRQSVYSKILEIKEE